MDPVVRDVATTGQSVTTTQAVIARSSDESAILRDTAISFSMTRMTKEHGYDDVDCSSNFINVKS